MAWSRAAPSSVAIATRSLMSCEKELKPCPSSCVHSTTSRAISLPSRCKAVMS